MNKLLWAASSLFLCIAWIATEHFTPAASAYFQDNPQVSVVDAANTFLASLGKDRRAKAMFGVDSKELYNWHFIPRGRLGVPMNELTPSQQDKLEALLRAALSEHGVKKIQQVRALESILREKEGRDRRYRRDSEMYYISFYGEPSKSKSWFFRFEGHHISANFALLGDTLLASTPLMLGANPSIVTSGPKKGLRVLGSMEDLGRELVKSLSDSQRKSALGEKPEELKGMMRPRYTDTLPDGVSVDELDGDQQRVMRDLLKEFTRNLTKSVQREITRNAVNAGLEKIQFVWRGGTEPGQGHSYLIHGPTFVISYANFQNGAAHIHAGMQVIGGDEFGGKNDL